MASFSRIITDALGVGSYYEHGPTHASANYNLDNNGHLTLQPRLSYQYYVNFVLTDAGASKMALLQMSQYDVNDIQPFVNTVSMPSFKIEGDLLNEYDRPRINQTKLSKDPVSMTMYDVVNGATLKLWQAYYEFYFKDGIKTDSKTTKAPVETSTELHTSNFGYNLSSVTSERYFFDYIEIALVHGSREQKITLHKPMIVSFDHSAMSFSDSKLIELKYTFDAEYIEYDTQNSRISSRNLDRYKKGEFLDLPQLAISAWIDGIVGDLNPFKDSKNPFLKSIGGYAQDKIKGAVSKTAGNVIRKASTSVLDTLGDISPKAVYNSPPPVPLPRNFKPKAG